MIYYKYKSDTKFTEDIFLKRKVYLSNAEGLNDPFECSLIDIGKDWIAEEIKKMEGAGVAGFILEAKRAIDSGNSFFGLSGKEIENILEKFREFKEIREASAYRSELMKQFTGYPPANAKNLFSGLDAQLLSVGIFSLSTNPENQSMWAYYAGDHSGICLGFKKSKDSRLSNPENFLQVIYSDELPEMNKNGFKAEMAFSIDDNGQAYTSSYKIAFSDSTFQKAITTKSKHWQHEDEWRYVEPYPGEFDWPAPLVEVIFGLKCTEERRNYYIKLVEENVEYPVRFFEIVKKPKTNQLEKVPFVKSISEPLIKSRPKELRSEMDSKEFGSKIDRLIMQGNYREALIQVNENLKNDPDSPFLLNLKGMVLGYAQQPDKALICFTRITELHPEDSTGWYQKAVALSALGRNRDAVIELRNAYRIDPKDPSICYNLGIELFKTNADKEEVLRYLREAYRLNHRKAYGAILEIENKS